jgi:hypothetical protein
MNDKGMTQKEAQQPGKADKSLNLVSPEFAA